MRKQKREKNTRNYGQFGIRHLCSPLGISPKDYIVFIYLFVYNSKFPIYMV
jgi:hypothetical protein